MSEDEIQTSHNDLWLAPDGHLHYGAGKIQKNEQIPLAVYIMASKTLKKIKRSMQDKKFDEVNDHIIDFNEGLVRTYISMSGSVDGFRSKQITKKEASNAYVPREEEKEGRLKRWFRRGKKDELDGN
jgi:hypothetical protein